MKQQMKQQIPYSSAKGNTTLSKKKIQQAETQKTNNQLIAQTIGLCAKNYVCFH